jgi:Rrf2 family protein
MLTHTSELAIKALMFMAMSPGKGLFTPQGIADQVGCSPAYLAKTLSQLARHGILRSRRGAQGGMELARKAEAITLLDIVETCQGLLATHYCDGIGDAMGPVCAFHRAMWEVRETTRATLARWTLADLVARPAPTGKLAGSSQCRVDFLRGAVLKRAAKSSRTARKGSDR